jgi:hypothetical protein
MSWFVMRVSRYLGGAVAAGTTALLLVLVLRARTNLDPPVLELVSIEPAGISDVKGTELWLVTFNIRNCNPDTPQARARNSLSVKGGGKVIEAKVGNRWRGVEGTSLFLGPRKEIGIRPGEQYESQLLTSVGTDSCRVWLNYRGYSTSLTTKGVANFIALRLPVSVRSRISYKFWRWVGFSGFYQDDAPWQTTCLELVLRPKAVPAPKAPNQTSDRMTRSAVTRLFQHDCAWRAPRDRSA